MIMSGIQLTYDSRQDRILLLSGMEITVPDWWLTRREVKKVLKSISTVTMSQYETEKMLQQFSFAAQAAKQGASEFIDKAKSYRDFHREHSGTVPPIMNSLSQVEARPDQYPLVSSAQIDLTDQQGVKLLLLGEQQRGVCLEFNQEGLFRFNNMLFTVARKAHWI